MADITAENILAAAAAENEAMSTDANDSVGAAVETVADATAEAANDAAAAGTTTTAATGAASTTVAATGTAAAAAATTAAATIPAPAIPVAATAAAAVVVPNRPFNLKWLQAADKNRQHFADELFNTTFTQENIEKLVQELKTTTANKIASSHRLCEADHTYTVQIATHGWLRVPTHLTRIELPYSVLSDDSGICIFVRDLKKPPQTPGRQAKAPNLADLTVRHYEQLLNAAKVDISNVTIMPISQLFNDHPSLDQRRKLTYLYDKFMVEASVATRVNAFLGSKLLYEARAAFPIDLQAPDLAGEYDVVLRQVFYQSHQASDHQFVRPQVCVGRESQDVAQIAENIIDLLGQLGAVQPGGAPNVSALYLRASGNVATAVELFKDTTASAPVIPPPEVAATAADVVVKNADGTETVVPAPAEEKLTVSVPNLTQHIIDNQHYIVYDGDDDYSEEFEGDAPPQQRQQGGQLQQLQQRPQRGSVVLNPEAPRRRTLLSQPQQQYQQAYNQQQQQNVARAGQSTMKKMVATASSAVAAGGTDVDQLVLRGLKKLLAQQNLAGLMAGGGGQQQQQYNNGGGHQRGVQNGGGVRRTNNQQLQQQHGQQLQQQRGGVMARNQAGGGNVQRRRNNNNNNNSGGQLNGSNGMRQQNRRYI